MTEASAKPIITAFTTQSACTNMPQGDRSCGSVAPSTLGAVGGPVKGSVASASAG